MAMLPHLVLKRLRAAWRWSLAVVAGVTLWCAYQLGYGPYPVRWSIPIRIQAMMTVAILVLVVAAWTLRRIASARDRNSPVSHLVLSVAAYLLAVSITGFALTGAFLGSSPRKVYPPCLVAAATLALLRPFRREVYEEGSTSYEEGSTSNEPG